MEKLLVVIDMQNDFIDQALGSAEAEKTVAECVDLIADKSYTKVIATMDTHGENYMETLEGKYLPVPHCIKNSDGWKLHPLIQEALDARGAEIIEKPTFGSINLIDLVKKIQPDEITVCGLCTDICVISNALLMRAALPDTEIKVVAKACAGTTIAKHNAAIAVMESCQIQIA